MGSNQVLCVAISGTDLIGFDHAESPVWSVIQVGHEQGLSRYRADPIPERVWNPRPDPDRVLAAGSVEGWTPTTGGLILLSLDFQRLPAEHGTRCSLGRLDNCWDNAVKESFFKTLKVERAQLQRADLLLTNGKLRCLTERRNLLGTN